jgi:hypothetical protein
MIRLIVNPFGHHDILKYARSNKLPKMDALNLALKQVPILLERPKLLTKSLEF